MSTTISVYGIVGYDLTGCETKKFSDWMDSEEYEELTYGHNIGEIQLFVGDDYMYLGYIFNVENIENSFSFEVDSEELDGTIDPVMSIRKHLVDIGVIGKPALDISSSVIIFNVFC